MLDSAFGYTVHVNARARNSWMVPRLSNNEDGTIGSEADQKRIDAVKCVSVRPGDFHVPQVPEFAQRKQMADQLSADSKLSLEARDRSVRWSAHLVRENSDWNLRRIRRQFSSSFGIHVDFSR